MLTRRQLRPSAVHLGPARIEPKDGGPQCEGRERQRRRCAFAILAQVEELHGDADEVRGAGAVHERRRVVGDARGFYLLSWCGCTEHWGHRHLQTFVQPVEEVLCILLCVNARGIQCQKQRYGERQSSFHVDSSFHLVRRRMGSFATSAGSEVS